MRAFPSTKSDTQATTFTLPSWNAHSPSPASAPAVAPFVMTTQLTRLQRSLQGVNCCFCEESLEYTLTGEKLVALQCGHICHHECLYELIDTSLPLVDNFEYVMPACGTCGEKSIPLDGTLHSDILQKANSAPNTPAVISPSVYSPYARSPRFSPMVSPRIWSPLSAQPDYKKLSTISQASSFSSSSDHSNHSESSVSSMDSSEYRPESAATTPSPGIQEMALAIPRPILEIRTHGIASPTIELTSEVDTLTANPSEDAYVTVSVCTHIPSIPTAPVVPTLIERQEITEEIEKSLTEWKDLVYSDFGLIRLCDTFSMSQNNGSWQVLDCYLFEHILVFVRRYENKPSRVKGSVALTAHLTSLSISSNSQCRQITLNLSDSNISALHMKTSDANVFENWYTALLDHKVTFPSHRFYPSDSPRAQPTSTRLPIDTVVLVPLSGSPEGSKFRAIKSAISSVISQMSLFDRLAIVPYGGGSQQYVYGFASGTWKPWKQVVESLTATARAGSRTDLLSGLATALGVLTDCKARSPLSSIMVISDSLTDISESSLEIIASRAMAINACIYSFGVSNHSADRLNEISSRCSGSYIYLRKWDELTTTFMGQFRALQSATHQTVSISLDPAAGVTIVGLAGHNFRPPLKCMTIPESPPPTPDGYPNGFSNCLYNSAHKVDLGTMMANEQRTFLVQVQVKSEALLPVLKLLTVSLGRKERTSISVPFNLSKEAVTTPMGIRSPLNRDFQKPFSLETEVLARPSILFGSLLDVPSDKYNIQVVQRRIQLVGIKILESVVRADFKLVNVERVCKSIGSARVLIKRLRAGSKQSLELKNLNRSERDRLRAIHGEVNLLVDILDEVLQTTADKIRKTAVVFEEDYRKVLVQNIGVLKYERGYTTRSPLERAFRRWDANLI